MPLRSGLAVHEPDTLCPEREGPVVVQEIEVMTWEAEAATLRRTFLSPQAEEIFGCLDRQLASAGLITDMVHPEDRQRVLEVLRSVADTGRDRGLEYRVRDAAGCTRWIRDIVRLVEDGRTVRFRGTMVDVTEHKRAEEGLSRAEKKYRRIFENAAEGIFQVSFAGRLVTANSALARICGYESPGEMIESISDVRTELYAESDERTEMLRRLQHEGVVSGFEVQLYRKDGDLIWVSINARMLREEGGEAVGFEGTIEDITRRRQAEEALRNSEERLRLLVQNSSDIISILNPDGAVRYQSPSLEKVLGRPPEAGASRNILDLVHPEDHEEVRRFLRRTGESRPDDPPVKSEFRLKHEDGTWRYMEAVGANLLHHPSVNGIVVNCLDVTKRKQEAEQLQHSIDALLAVYEASQLLSSTLEFEEIGTRLLKIMQRISSLSTAVISTLDEEGRLRVWRAIGFENLWAKARYSPEVQAVLNEVLQSGEHRTMVLQDPREGSEEALSTLFMPLRMRENTLGVLEIYGSDSLKEREMVEILISLTSKAANALENARLYRELSRREQRLQSLVGKLLTTQEEERRRVSYEVHDGMTQMAVGAYQHLQAFASYNSDASMQHREMLETSMELLRKTIEESRRVIADLRPTVLDDFGLSTAVRHQVEAFREKGWDIDFKDSIGDERLPAAVETTLYRIAQEALTNVRKHARTRRVHINLEYEGDSVLLQVKDWGQGFNPAELTTEGPGERVGISGMRERVALIGGELEMHTMEGQGTLVIAHVPLKEGGIARDVVRVNLSNLE
jgi:PAS domain S-box-containing protein